MMKALKKSLLPLLLAITMLLMSVSVSAGSSNTFVDVSKVTVSANNVIYNGKKKASVTVKYKGKKLKEGKDYKVSGKGTNYGTYTLTVKGLGAYAKLNKKVKYRIYKQNPKIKLQERYGPKNYKSEKYTDSKNGKATLKLSKKATYLLTSRYTANGKSFNKVKSYKVIKKTGKISFNKKKRYVIVNGKGTLKLKIVYGNKNIKTVTVTVKVA